MAAERRDVARAKNRKSPPRTISVAFEEDNIIDEETPKIYYVIIGRGPMAVVNHRTLRDSEEGRRRIGDRIVMHIGFPNPWPKYLRHGLGQPNHLLSLPGFRNQPSVGGEPIDGGLDSQHFGGCVDREFEQLGKDFPGKVEVRKAWVALIQAKGENAELDDEIDEESGGPEVRARLNGILAEPWPEFGEDDAPYRLCVYDHITKIAEWIYASHIDICTGPGRAIVNAPVDSGHNDLTKKAMTPPWMDPEDWSHDAEWNDRRVLNGVDAIRDEVRWNEGERICVTAGGGVGLNAAEKARNNGCTLDWFGRRGLMAIFENPRNITFLRNPGTNRACPYGKRVDYEIHGENDLIAFDDKHRMGMGAVLSGVLEIDQDDAVDVVLSHFIDVPRGSKIGTPAAEVHIRDWWSNDGEEPAYSVLNINSYWECSDAYRDVAGQDLPSTRYDRLVVPNGQVTKAVGQPHRFANSLTFTPLEKHRRMVALHTPDRLVRVLGAACNDYPGKQIGTYKPATPKDIPSDRMWAYHATLPVSAVPDGFIICGINTALANGYFGARRRNRNVNTMTYEEIRGVVGDEGLAKRIRDRRRENNGYEDLADLQRTCESEAPALANFQFAYGG